MNWKPELDDLARREAFAREMGGVDKVKRQRDQGRLTVRERIDRLVDGGSFHEVGAVSGSAEYDASGELVHVHLGQYANLGDLEEDIRAYALGGA